MGMTDDAEPARLFLVTPPAVDLELCPALLSEALEAAEVAAVLIAGGEEAAGKLVPLVQAGGAAALVLDDTRVAGRTKADGVHVATGIGDLRAAVEAFRPKRTVGAGNLHTRHAAMEAGEIGADYVLFGRPHGDTHDEPHPRALDLAEWWSELMEVPAVVVAGRALDSAAEAAATGAAFVALHNAIWSYPGGPGEAVRRAAAILAGPGRQAA